MSRAKRHLITWVAILAFSALGQGMFATDGHDPAEDEGGGNPAEIEYCSECNCCSGKWWPCSRNHSDECGLFGCPDHNYTHCDN